METVEEVAIDKLSLPELEAHRAELLDKLASIETQLGDPNRLNPETQERMSGHEWHEWRRRAIQARRHTLAELRKVNARLSELKKLNPYVEDSITDRLERIEEKVNELHDYIIVRKRTSL